MAPHKHIIIDEPGQERDYTSTHRGGGRFSTPPRDRRIHARRLLNDVNQARNDANVQAEETGHTIHNLCLEIISEQDYALKIESLENLRSGIEVRFVKRIENRVHATIYVPEGKLSNLSCLVCLSVPNSFPFLRKSDYS